MKENNIISGWYNCGYLYDFAVFSETSKVNKIAFIIKKE